MVEPTGKGSVRLWALPLLKPDLEGTSPSNDSRPIESEAPTPTTGPIKKKKGAWLQTVRSLRGQRTSHSIDLEKRAFDLDEAKARAGDDVAQLHRFASRFASEKQKQDLKNGDLSFGAFYRLAAKAVFGSNYAHTLRYAQIEARMRKVHLEREFSAMLAALPRPMLIKLRREGVAPLELFNARARDIASWKTSPHPMTRDEVKIELAYDRRSAELDSLPAELTGVGYARLLEARERENVDVLVIGAGASGIAAANTLLDRGHSVTVLESKHRDGGRAYTEYTTLGMPFDHGCAWIHESTKNPMMPLIEGLGYATVATEKFQKVFAGGDPVADAPVLRERMDAVGKRWQQAAKKAPNAKASMVSTPEHRLDRMAAEVLGPLELALELDQFSVGEFQCIVEEKDDRLVAGGLGNVIHAFAHGLPIELDAPAQTIKWSKDGVEVESNGRTFRAKKILLTVSPWVLANKIKFDPPLPAWKVESFQQLQMSSFEKVALRFETGALAKFRPFERACGFDDDGRSFEIMLKPFSGDVAIVMVGGDFAKELLAKPESQAVDYALDVIAKHYGEKLRSKFKGGERTEWTLDEDVGGTWAITKIGSTDGDRAIYSKPVDNTVFIGGEACGGEWAATVNGAFFNGIDVAENIHGLLAVKKAL
jgi:monoamine oxidase